MKDRTPYSLKWVIICYNIFQIISCSLIVKKVMYLKLLMESEIIN